MEAVVFGLAAALVYGAADFTGGLATRRTPALAVVLISQLAGLVVLLAALPLIGGGQPEPRDLWLGAVAGVGGGTGVALLYRGLAIGRMSIVAPVTAVGAAALPVIAGLALGERPAPLALVGVVLALLAVVAVSAGPERLGSGSSRRGLAEAGGAGAAFGVFFIVLSAIGDGAGLSPLLAARSSIVVVGLAALATRTPVRPATQELPRIALAGILDMAANVLYVLAARTGLLSLVAVLVSLYPASTVLLARFALGERLTRPQLGGIALAVAGAALIAAA